MVMRIQPLVEVQQAREKLLDKAQDNQHKIKRAFDKRKRKEDFQLGDLVLKWDAPKKDKGKNGKLEALWIVPFNIYEVFSNNTYKLQSLEDFEVFLWPYQWALSEEIFCLSHDWFSTIIITNLFLFLLLISDSITQNLRHWNYTFLASPREHAIPCGAKCYYIKFSIVTSDNHESMREGKYNFLEMRISCPELFSLAPPLNVVGRSLKLVGEKIFGRGAKIARVPRSQITFRSTTSNHFGATTCLGVKRP
jgi:hypothetical protein